MSESAVPGNAVVLPARKKRQSLHGYAYEHLEAFECALSSGVPYQTLIEAMVAAGFVKVTATPHEVFSQSSLDVDVTAAIGRRFRKLVRPPRPGSDEPDLLV